MASHRPPRLDCSMSWPSASAATHSKSNHSLLEITPKAFAATRSHSLTVGLWLIDDLNFYIVMIAWCWARTWYHWGGLIYGLWFVVMGLFWKNQNVCCWWGLILVSGFVDWFICGFVMELGLWIVAYELWVDFVVSAWWKKGERWWWLMKMDWIGSGLPLWIDLFVGL